MNLRSRLKDALKQSRPFFPFLGFIITMYLVIFSDNSDRFHQPDAWIFGPIDRLFLDLDKRESLPTRPKRESPTQLTKGNRNPNLGEIFIFVLDNSESISAEIPKPHWYDRVVNDLINEDFVAQYGPLLKERVETIHSVDAMKVQLFRMLADISSSDSIDHFAVWVVGNLGRRIFPDDIKDFDLVDTKFAPAIKKYTSRAIGAITVSFSPDSLETSTDFGHLIEQIAKTYEGAIESETADSGNRPSLIITFLSDLQHDIEDKLGNKQELIWQNWEDLRLKILDLANANIMANMIIVNDDAEDLDDDFPHYMQIFPVFDDHLQWHRLSKSPVSAEIKHTSLYPTVIANTELFFFYEDTSHVLNDIKLVAEHDGEVTIDIPLDLDYKRQGGVRLQWKITGIHDEKRSSGWITSNGRQILREKVLKRQIVVLKYPDAPQAESVQMTVSLESERSVYVIELKFVKILRESVAKVMVTFQLVGGLVLLWIVFIMLKAFVRRQNGTSGGGKDGSSQSLVTLQSG